MSHIWSEAIQFSIQLCWKLKQTKHLTFFWIFCTWLIISVVLWSLLSLTGRDLYHYYMWTIIWSPSSNVKNKSLFPWRNSSLQLVCGICIFEYQCISTICCFVHLSTSFMYSDINVCMHISTLTEFGWEYLVRRWTTKIASSKMMLYLRQM